MAAYGALVSLIKTLDTIRVQRPGAPHIPLKKDRIQFLHRDLIVLKQFIENTDDNTLIINQEAVLENLKTLIRKAAYKADDLIESWMYKRVHFYSNRSFLYPVFLFLCVLQVLLMLMMVLEYMPSALSSNVGYMLIACILILIVGVRLLIKSATRDVDCGNKELDLVLEDVYMIKEEILFLFGDVAIHQPTRLPAADSHGGRPRNDVVVGFERDLNVIRERLCDATTPDLQVVSIVGMGGSGKTTLARKVFYDSYIVSHFDICAWVSRECDMRQVVLDLLNSEGGMVEDQWLGKSGVELCVGFRKSLKKKKKRYLVVLDDKWETNIWDTVRHDLPHDCAGIRVLMTTRSSVVAHYVEPVFVHEMRFLSGHKSWSLLYSKVFLTGEYCPPELREVGKEIARYCGGLPLAIVVIGGLLHKGEKTLEFWRLIAENLSSIVSIEDHDTRCMEILSLSYHHLPHHLKPCFLYMGLFPEGYQIPVSKLVHLWVAEGFLEPNIFKGFEELAEEYLEDLIKRNLIVVSKRSSNGKIKTCIIHDLLWDLCIRNGRREHFLDVAKDGNDLRRAGLNNPRRLSVSPNILQTPQWGTLYNSTRSISCRGTHFTLQRHFYLGYTLLRVLDLAIVHFDVFPSEITKMVYLRYLALTYIGPLPSSISSLINIESMVLHDWIASADREYPSLPVEIWMMPKLRHLCVPSSFFPDARGAYNLKNLQTLLGVRNLKCGLDFLERIRNLKSLGVSYDLYTGPLMGWSQYHLENLVCLEKLETLKVLVMNCSDFLPVFSRLKIAFPESLKRLILRGCKLPWESMAIVGALPNLEVLKLKNYACVGTTWRPVEGQFWKLKFLLLQQIDLVEWVVADGTHFPRLQHLVIRCCSKLKEIPLVMGDIPALEMIELADSSTSVVSSARLIQEQQESYGNTNFQVRIDYKQRFKNNSTMRL